MFDRAPIHSGTQVATGLNSQNPLAVSVLAKSTWQVNKYNN